jgi:hypothetical protein
MWTQGYCKYRNIFMMASYFLVFYLSTVYDPNDLNVRLPPQRAASISSAPLASSASSSRFQSPYSTSSDTATRVTGPSANMRRNLRTSMRRCQ